MAEQWIQDRQIRENLERGKIDIRADLYSNYYYVKRRIATAKCRQNITQEIADCLSPPDEEWQGVVPSIQIKPWLYSVVPNVLPSTYHTWGSHTWDIEFQKGTFDKMDPERRQAFNEVFTVTRLMGEKQSDIFSAQARLKALSLPIDITPSDRIRYFELLAYHDEVSGLLELASQRAISMIEDIGFTYDKASHDYYRDYIPEFNALMMEDYGECFSPIVMPFLESTYQKMEEG